jgi:hypothetical protein
MKLYEFSNILKTVGTKRLVIRKSPTEVVPEHFHITEIGNVKKDFVDCGGVRRQLEYCAMQVWVADDINHRLTPDRLSSILDQGLKFIDDNNIVNFEIQERTVALYELFGMTISKDVVYLEVAEKKTACLAPDKCGVKSDKYKADSEDKSCCVSKGCC